MKIGKLKSLAVMSLMSAILICPFQSGIHAGEAANFDAYLKRPGSAVTFTFAVLGDIQGKGRSEKWRKAAAWLAGRKPAFWVPVGDIVDRGLKQEQWDAFSEDGAVLLKSSPVIPVIGNHDCYLDNSEFRFPALFYEQFPFFKFDKESPDGWYSFDYSNAHFTILNNYPCTGDRGKDKRIIMEEQKRWLETDLASSDKKWKFVFMHEPIYSSGPHGGDSAWLIPVWGALFDKYGVDVVFSGHTHAFELSCPIRNGEKNESGTVYYNCAGINYSAVPKGAWFTVSSQPEERLCLITLVKVGETSVTIETWNSLSGALFHSFSIGR